MAFIVLKNGKALTMSGMRARELDKVMRGIVQGTDKQKAFAATVKKIYFADKKPVEVNKLTERVTELFPMRERKDLI